MQQARRSEAEARESLTRFIEVADNLTDIVWTLDADLKPIFDRYLGKEPTTIPSETTATPLPFGSSPHKHRVSSVADSVAVADAVNSLSDTAAIESTVSENVSDTETLPLQATSSQTQAEQGLQPCSGVAVENLEQGGVSPTQGGVGQ